MNTKNELFKPTLNEEPLYFSNTHQEYYNPQQTPFKIYAPLNSLIMGEEIKVGDKNEKNIFTNKKETLRRSKSYSKEKNRIHFHRNTTNLEHGSQKSIIQIGHLKRTKMSENMIIDGRGSSFSNILKPKESDLELKNLLVIKNKEEKRENFEDVNNFQRSKILTTSQTKSRRIVNVKANSASKAKEQNNMISSTPTDPSKQLIKPINNVKEKEKKVILDSSKSIPQQIEEYIEKRLDVEVVEFFEAYKHQFFTKSKALHTYISKCAEPEKVRDFYLNENDAHFRNGLLTVMLKLFRNGTIVPHSYDNLRQEAVDEIEKWVIGWIHRKIIYGKLQEDNENQTLVVEEALGMLEDYKRKIDNEDTSF